MIDGVLSSYMRSLVARRYRQQSAPCPYPGNEILPML
jgi:hypothetical protein